VPLEALAGGIRLAFMVGAVIAMLAFVAALFVQRPAPQQGSWGH
jgi:DHA2 family lincomycin resistance protein-like MFS transporter